MLREDHAAGDRADLVAGAADALQPGGDRRRRLDLDDQVDGAHVDAQLEADEVATTAGRSPALSASSMCLRSSRETEPWWARAITGAAPAAARTAP